jgi:hypothetical protein
VGIRCADHVTPLYPQKLALTSLTSPTGGGRSVGIVRSRTKAMQFSLVPNSIIIIIIIIIIIHIPLFTAVQPVLKTVPVALTKHFLFTALPKTF